jgi:hypothetical protein
MAKAVKYILRIAIVFNKPLPESSGNTKILFLENSSCSTFKTAVLVAGHTSLDNFRKEVKYLVRVPLPRSFGLKNSFQPETTSLC